MVNFDLVIGRIGCFKGINGDKFIAAALGISPQDFSNRKKRGSLLPVIFEWAINENVNLDWLMKGEGEMRQPQPIAVSEKIEGFQPIPLNAERRHGVLFNRLQRIVNEGDKAKIEAVKAQLKAFDPGEKKPRTTHEDDGGCGDLDSRVA